jgi:hypothetical protein
MAKVWKILALLLVITTLVWLTTLWRWQSNQVDPGGVAVVMYLLVLPVLLTAALVGAVWGVGRMRRYAAAPIVPASSAKASAGQAQAGAPASAPPKPTHFTVLAAAAETRAGKAWPAACQAITKGDCKPELDPEIKDDEGLPVFTAPVDDVDTAFIADQLDQWAEQRAGTDEGGEWVGYQCPDEVPRALVLAEKCLGDMLDAVELQWPALGGLRLPDAGRPAGNAAALKVPTAVIRIGVPARWPDQARQLATQWLEQLLDPLVETGLQAAGQTRAMARNSRAAVQVHVHPVESAEAFWRLIDQQMQQWQRDGDPGLMLALVADSHVSPLEVDRWQARQELFSGQQQNGRVPGEAAAGLLLASPAWPALPDALPPIAWLHRAGVFERQKPADASGRISADTLQQAIADTLRAANADASSITHITTEADHRASRTAEVFQALQEVIPHIEPMEQVLRLGAGCGDMGIARLGVATALAAAQVSESDEPGLVLATFDPIARMALLVTPPRAPATPDNAAAAGKPAA